MQLPLKKIAHYEQIALMIANDICRGGFTEGQRISGRSVLAGRYGVSPETIRKALSLLHEQHITRASPGRGVYILSRQVACEFANKFRESNYLETLLSHLTDLTKQRDQLNTKIDKVIRQVVLFKRGILQNMHKTDELQLSHRSTLVGKSIHESQLRTVTGANIIAVRRDGRWHISPGQELLLAAEDILLVAGDNKALGLLRGLVKGKSAGPARRQGANAKP